MKKRILETKWKGRLYEKEQHRKELARQSIRARLVVYGIAEMDKKELAFFQKWLRMVCKELTTTKDLNIFSKRFRQTLYKS